MTSYLVNIATDFSKILKILKTYVKICVMNKRTAIKKGRAETIQEKPYKWGEGRGLLCLVHLRVNV